MARKVKSAKRPARNKAAAPRRTPRKQPETLRLYRITPSLTVNDLGKSLAFYRDTLGFHVEEEWKNEGKVIGMLLRAGTVSLMIGQDDFAKGRDRRKGEGLRLYCSTRQDIDKLAQTIKARGDSLAQEPANQPWGTREFAVVDPDGFKMTFTTE